MALATESRNGVSFKFGELVIFHVSNPFLADEEADSIVGSPLTLDGGVALSLANHEV